MPTWSCSDGRGTNFLNHIMVDGEQVVSIEVPVVRMNDQLLVKDVPTVIKIDVKGHERAALAGGAKTLADARVSAVIMEVNGSGKRYGLEDEELIAIMNGHGFRSYSYDPFARRLMEWSPDSGNAIFVRDLAAVSERVQSARRYRLVNGLI